MADETLTPDDIKLLKEWQKLAADAREDWSQILAETDGVEQRLQDILGSQLEFASQNDKHLVYLEEMRRLELQHIAQRKKDLAEKIKNEQIIINQLAERIKQQRANNQAVSDVLLKEKKNAQARRNRAKKKQQELNAEAKALDKQLKQKEKIKKIEDEAEAIAENQLTQVTGMVTQAQSLGQLLAKNLAEGEGFEETMVGINKAFEKMFTKANLAMTTMGKMEELGASFQANMLGAGGALMQFAETDIRFVRETGGLQTFGAEMKNLKSDFHDLNFTFAETEQAYQGLFENSRAFTVATSQQRKVMAQQAATLERFGVSTTTFAQAVDGLNKTFGETPAEVKTTTSQLTKFARALGVGPNKMLSDFNQNLDLVAKYGKEKGVEVFKALATTAHKTGIEFKDLLGITEQFNTFESAADAASQLNFVLGGPMLNSVEMLKASDEERIQMLKDSMAASGKAFADMGRFEKELMAKTLGVDVAVAQKLFSDDNINSIEDATKAIQDQANGMGDLGAEAAANTTLAEKERLAQEAQILTMQGLADTIKSVNEAILDLQRFFAPVGVVLGGIATVAQVAISGVALFGATAAKAALTAGVALGGITVPFLAIGAAIVAVGALFAVFWDDITAGVSAFLGWFDNILGSIWGMVTNVGSAISSFFGGIMEGIKNFFKPGINWIIEKLNLLSFEIPDWVPVIGGQTWGIDIPLLAQGTTNFKGGPAIVGEKGPEMVTLGQGTNVITNENVSNIIQTNTEVAAAASARAPTQQEINITLELDGDVLARHAAKTATDVLKSTFAFNRSTGG
ncbi:MAG: hypothetical protein GOVbin630_36 [Prokaryotic dsDNA virus sp.]|nr:MAG: hypothetical protein GOVbin630_36 [Prokaryotic dsDNA virus sp.]|tara:strand:- start:28464 stop:30860 length:2397 start_codon:yes stop_codon:yes gene_type:complete